MNEIEVYIRKKEVITGEAVIGRPVADHWCTAKDTLKTEKIISEADRLALEVVNEVAKGKNLRVKVYDISGFKERLKAMSKGIKKTPTIIIGKDRIEGELTSELLRSKLEYYFHE